MQHCQPWVSTPLVDVVQNRGLKPCKLLLGPENFYRNKVSDMKRKGAPSATGEKQKEDVQKRRRESLQSWHQEHRPSVLPAALWRCMNASTMSVGRDLLPGASFR